ncbi:hypothetical protein [Aquimonas sp.]|jgi:hypothetical protein|uniref:hypothetical protein n=1 Tax=Aquimonas sp. TaxID=1872588 RepID=UPI0037BFED89
MRQIFRSRRLETVEGVARMLNEAGIETYISERRAYKGNRRGQFSFTDESGPEPALWIVNGADITQARQLMSDAGLLNVGRVESLVSAEGQQTQITPATKRVSMHRKLRIGLLLLVVALATLHAVRLAFA